MASKKRAFLIKAVFLLLILSLALPVGVNAVEPRDSDYLNTYSAYIHPAGWGKVQVWFEVDGAGYMDKIGSLSIWLYESTEFADE